MNFRWEEARDARKCQVVKLTNEQIELRDIEG